MKINPETYYICRSVEAGVYAGYITEQNGSEVTMKNVRNIWYWDGAKCLMDMSVYGVTKPENCKFSVNVDELILTNVCEIIPCTPAAEAIIKGVKEWRA